MNYFYKDYKAKCINEPNPENNDGRLSEMTNYNSLKEIDLVPGSDVISFLLAYSKVVQVFKIKVFTDDCVIVKN